MDQYRYPTRSEVLGRFVTHLLVVFSLSTLVVASAWTVTEQSHRHVSAASLVDED